MRQDLLLFFIIIIAFFYKTIKLSLLMYLITRPKNINNPKMVLESYNHQDLITIGFKDIEWFKNPWIRHKVQQIAQKVCIHCALAHFNLMYLSQSNKICCFPHCFPFLSQSILQLHPSNLYGSKLLAMPIAIGMI